MKLNAQTPDLPNVSLELVNAAGESLAKSEPGYISNLVHKHQYTAGDLILMRCSQAPCWVRIKLDAALDSAIVYLPEQEASYLVRLENVGVSLPSVAFQGSKHCLSIEALTTAEAGQNRTLSYNPYDQHENSSFFPHAWANVETRGEAWFAAANAIDGYYANFGHGPWPYQSWGINRDPEAALTIDLGVSCEINEIRFTIRADFPHDNYWTHAELRFDTGETLTLAIEQTHLPQQYRLETAIRARQVTLEKLIQAEGESPFPALTQLELRGRVADV